jgi:magnesium chelatase subunit D
LHRLAEAKGAVELLLADCYVRRDQVAVLAFRGAGAELLLPPTRSLVRAKRSLAGLPGGGGTPLAAGLDAAWTLAEAVARRGDTPLVVLLTDGRANIGRDGQPDRGRAEQDALASAQRWRGSTIAAVVVDTSARPEPRARALAQRMDALYLPLPHARADTLNQAVQAVARGAAGR